MLQNCCTCRRPLSGGGRQRQQEVEVEGHGCNEVDNVDGRTKKAHDVWTDGKRWSHMAGDAPWTDGKTYDQFEREPGVTGALDVKKCPVL